MSVQDEEFSSDAASSDDETGKRKNNEASHVPLKKVKYEDIQSEKPKKTKNELYKPPTVEELNELKETQNLYNNNLFRLQIEELVNEVKIKNKHKKAFSSWYDSFQKCLEDLPKHSISLSDIRSKTDKKLSKTDKLINFIANESIQADQDLNIMLDKPEKSELFGLHSLDALPGPQLSVNINLTMPRACFQVKDYLNNRYFVKRYYYLAYISYYLKEKNTGGEINTVFHNSNNLLPIIQVKLNEKVTVNIFATPTENYFKLSRCSAEINNLKVNVFNTGEITEAPTIFYNTALAHDLTLSTNNNCFQENFTKLPNILEAIKLIRVWLAQRELNSGFGAFNDELILYFLLYLLIKKKINKHMSSYQVIRNFWNFISETDLTQNPITLSDSKPEVVDQFKESFDVVFLDKTGYYNVTAFLNVGLYEKIKKECAIAFKLLDDEGINAFHCLFITKLTTELQYDLIINLKSDSKFSNIVEEMSDDDRTQFLDYPDFFVVKFITKILHRGLNKRALNIVPLFKYSNSEKICFGINLNQSDAFNILEKGPELNDPQEKEFKEFWGHLATDRRFKDGSVCVAVYFKTETVKERRDIIKVIIDWVVSKLKLKYRLHYNDFENLIVNKKIVASYPMGTNEESTLKIIAASDDLAQKLRSLETPLAITGVHSTADTFCMTDVFPPISSNYPPGTTIAQIKEHNIVLNEKKSAFMPRYNKAIDCVLQLEHSTKWPKDLEALRHMKIAFFCEISKCLEKKYNLATSVHRDHLDVMHQGFVFRYSLYLSREVGLLKKETTNNGVVVYKDTPESFQLELKYNIVPKVIGALKGLQSQYPSFGPTTALIKRWLRSQFIDDFHFPDDVINLLSASLFLNQSAFDIPSVPQIGFLRFLKFFSELQWHIQPVIVNFNDEITKEQIAEIDSKLLQNRDSLPNLFIATPFDDCQSMFTKTSPSKEVLRRVKQLAEEALTVASIIIHEDASLSVKSLFIHNLEGYDVIIHIRPLVNTARHESVTDESKAVIRVQAFNPKESTKVPITNFNPVTWYIKKLRDNYGEIANFFIDYYGGNTIGVLWLPKMLEAKDFKVSQVSGRKLEDGKLVLNKDALIEDFFTLGKGIIKSIDKIK